MEEEENVVRS